MAQEVPWGRITYEGHATTGIEVQGVRFLTDPVLRARIGHLGRHGPLPRVAAPDVVLISHAHRDHLDLPSLRRLGPDLHVVTPRGVGRLLRSLRLAELTELDEGDRVSFGDVVVQAVPAAHETRRTPLGSRTPSLGFVIGDRRRIYFAGDTALHDGLAALAPLDVALLPIWGWGATLGGDHMDPIAAAQALTLLQPRMAIPIHWGTLYPLGLAGIRPRPLSDPPLRFADAAAVVAPQVDVRILSPGESLDLMV